VTLSIALCTGVLLEDSLELLARAGVARIDRGQLGRRLLLEKDGVRVVLVRPADVAAYVDHGAADLGSDLIRVVEVEVDPKRVVLLEHLA